MATPSETPVATTPKASYTPFSSLKEMEVEQLDELLKKAAKSQADLKTQTNLHKMSFPQTGKLISALAIRLAEGIKNRTFSKSMTVKDLYKSITKEPINSTAYSCSGAFSAFVESGLMPEPDYDDCQVRNLVVGNQIVDACKGDLNHDAVTRACEALKRRAKDSLKVLQSILAEIKPAEPMDMTEALKKSEAIIADKHATVVLSSIIAHIAHIEDHTEARQIWISLLSAQAMFAKNIEIVHGENGQKTETRRFPQEVLNSWTKEYLKGLPTPVVLKTDSVKPEDAKPNTSTAAKEEEGETTEGETESAESADSNTQPETETELAPA